MIIRKAKSVDDYAAVTKLVNDSCLASGYTLQPEVVESPGTTVLVAEVSGKIIGTVSMVKNGPEGLPNDEDFPGTMGRLKETYLNLGSVFRIYIDSGTSAALTALFTEVIKTFCVADWDKYVCSLHPRHAKIYIRLLGMEPIDKQHCVSVDAPGILLCGDARATQAHWNRLRKRRDLLPLVCRQWEMAEMLQHGVPLWKVEEALDRAEQAVKDSP